VQILCRSGCFFGCSTRLLEIAPFAVRRSPE
jgi:hypothetical protein